MPQFIETTLPKDAPTVTFQPKGSVVREAAYMPRNPSALLEAG
jgi:hypothetical protein